MIKKLRSKLLLQEPFIGYLLLKLDLIEDQNVAYMATNGVYLKYNSKNLEKFTKEKIKGIIVHEILHCVLLHPTRGHAWPIEKIRAIATDYVVNDYILTFTKYELPDIRLYDPQYHNMSVDKVYHLLSQQSDDEINEQYEVSQTMGDFELNDNTTIKKEGKYDKSLEDVWKQNLIEADGISKNCGSMAGLSEQLVGDIIHTALPWENLLKDFMVENTTGDTDWSAPNRRFIADGLYLPSSKDESLESLVVALDTSCSVDEDELAIMQHEVNNIISELEPEQVIVIQCDTDVNKVTYYSADDYPLAINFYGRGGTRFEPVFNYILENNLDPTCLIYFTDLGGNFNFKPPNYPLMWVNTTIGSEEKAPFGVTIGINK